MPKFGPKSLAQLSTCHPDLQRLFREVIKYYDCSITEGHRNQADQDRYFAEGKTKLKWPDGEHNGIPSRALDAYPFPIDFADTKRAYHFGGFVQGMAAALGIDIRWGGDWDGDTDLKDQTFNDTPHFELKK